LLIGDARIRRRIAKYAVYIFYNLFFMEYLLENSKGWAKTRDIPGGQSQQCWHRERREQMQIPPSMIRTPWTLATTRTSSTSSAKDSPHSTCLYLIASRQIPFVKCMRRSNVNNVDRVVLTYLFVGRVYDSFCALGEEPSL
jgi:hypothetical protein